MALVMDLITKERERLLQRAARIYGLSFTAVALICAILPGAIDWFALLLSLPLFMILAGAQIRMGMSRSLVWVGLALVSGTAIIGIFRFVGSGPSPEAGYSSIIELAAASLASCAIVLTSSAPRIVLLVASFLVIGSGTVLIADGCRTCFASPEWWCSGGSYPPPWRCGSASVSRRSRNA